MFYTRDIVDLQFILQTLVVFFYCDTCIFSLFCVPVHAIHFVIHVSDGLIKCLYRIFTIYVHGTESDLFLFLFINSAYFRYISYSF